MTSKNKFIDVKVTVIQNPDGTFTPAYAPEVIQVTDADSVINFQLDSHTNKGIKVSSCVVRQENNQLGNPCISKSGRQVVLSDANTLAGKFNLDFTFEKNGNSGHTCASTFAKSADCDAVGDFPEIENVPPGV